MTKTALISARIDPALKNSAELVFQELGLTASQAITIFMSRSNCSRDCLSLSHRSMNSARRLCKKP